MIHAIDNQLRCVDITRVELTSVSYLPCVIVDATEDVFPADIIPIGNREGEPENIFVFNKFPKELVCRRAGTASLRCEKLDNCGRLMGALGADGTD